MAFEEDKKFQAPKPKEAEFDEPTDGQVDDVFGTQDELEMDDSVPGDDFKKAVNDKKVAEDDDFLGGTDNEKTWNKIKEKAEKGINGILKKGRKASDQDFLKLAEAHKIKEEAERELDILSSSRGSDPLAGPPKSEKDSFGTPDALEMDDSVPGDDFEEAVNDKEVAEDDDFGSDKKPSFLRKVLGAGVEAFKGARFANFIERSNKKTRERADNLILGHQEKGMLKNAWERYNKMSGTKKIVVGGVVFGALGGTLGAGVTAGVLGYAGKKAIAGTLSWLGISAAVGAMAGAATEVGVEWEARSRLGKLEKETERLASKKESMNLDDYTEELRKLTLKKEKILKNQAWDGKWMTKAASVLAGGGLMAFLMGVTDSVDPTPDPLAGDIDAHINPDESISSGYFGSEIGGVKVGSDVDTAESVIEGGESPTPETAVDSTPDPLAGDIDAHINPNESISSGHFGSEIGGVKVGSDVDTAESVIEGGESPTPETAPEISSEPTAPEISSEPTDLTESIEGDESVETRTASVDEGSHVIGTLDENGMTGQQAETAWANYREEQVAKISAEHGVSEDKVRALYESEARKIPPGTEVEFSGDKLLGVSKIEEGVLEKLDVETDVAVETGPTEPTEVEDSPAPKTAPETAPEPETELEIERVNEDLKQIFVESGIPEELGENVVGKMKVGELLKLDPQLKFSEVNFPGNEATLGGKPIEIPDDALRRSGLVGKGIIGRIADGVKANEFELLQKLRDLVDPSGKTLDHLNLPDSQLNLSIEEYLKSNNQGPLTMRV